MPSLAETRPEVVELARKLRHTRSGRQRSLREISAELAARVFVAERTGKQGSRSEPQLYLSGGLCHVIVARGHY